LLYLAPSSSFRMYIIWSSLALILASSSLMLLVSSMFLPPSLSILFYRSPFSFRYLSSRDLRWLSSFWKLTTWFLSWIISPSQSTSYDSLFFKSNVLVSMSLFKSSIRASCLLMSYSRVRVWAVKSALSLLFSSFW
jgi:hypothetical protein